VQNEFCTPYRPTCEIRIEKNEEKATFPRIINQVKSQKQEGKEKRCQKTIEQVLHVF